MAEATAWQRVKKSVKEVLPSSKKTCLWMIKVTVILKSKFLSVSWRCATEVFPVVFSS